MDLGVDWSDEEFMARIKDYDALIVRSATKVTAEVIEAGTRLSVVGRAGVGVDNVDMKAATKRGIIVVNAPTSNVLSAAEHTIAMLMACARNIPQAHQALKEGRWERSKYGGVELMGKTLGIIGLGRIGFLVAERARGLKMEVVAYDPYVPAERFRELGLERAESPDAHLPGGRLHQRPSAQEQGDDGLHRRRGVRQDEGRRARGQRGARRHRR